MAEDYGKTILEATQIIVDGALSGLEYDKTVICTIINNEKAYRGEYTVSDGSSTFLAYSENTDYSKGTSVYVSIPNGDYSKQKLITGKYLTVESDYYTYTSPWKRFVDITGDLIQSNDSASILANDISEDYNENLKCKEVEIWNRDFTDGSNYTCIGLKADFRTWLSSFGTEFGTYGLRLYITTTDQLTSQSKKIVKVVSATLNNYDMYGNPYSFETFYEQQKVFDISGLGNITNMKLVLFQGQDFQDALGNTIPYLDENGKKLNDNIFVQNVYLALGYDISEFDSDKVLLYTLETEKYDATSTDEENRKILRVRWIHIEDDGSINCYDEPADINSNIAVHWYKYKLGQGIADNIAGAFWIEQKSWLNTFQQTIDPAKDEQEEKYKIVIETPVTEFLASLQSLDTDVIEAKRRLQEAQDEYDHRSLEYETRASEENAQLLEQATADLEDVQDAYNKAVTEYSAMGNYYESNILTLTNETLIANKATVDLVQGLSILCDVDGYKGVYTLYDQTNQIQNTVEANKMRTLTATYESLLTGDSDLDTAESITWQIPITNTMIYPPENGKEYNTEHGDQYSISDDGRFALIKRDGEAETGNIGTSFPHAVEQQFRIKDYFTESATNNTIFCYVVKNQVTYSASVELVFGPMGTNGTDYTFVLRMETDRTCVYDETNPMPLKIEAALYDYNNLEVLHANNCAVTYKWYSHDEQMKLAFCNAEGDLLNSNGEAITRALTTDDILLSAYRPPVDTSDSHLCCYIRRLTAQEMRTQQKIQGTPEMDTVPYYYILEADITTNVDGGARPLGDVTLNAYLPIPYSGNSNKYTQIEGTTKIVYNTQGTNPYYYKDRYKIYEGSNEITEGGIEWSAICAEALVNNNGTPTSAAAYYPKISSTGYVTPPSVFTSGSDKRFSAIAKDDRNNICWIQPIMIFQDAYSSAMLNAWDGSLTIDEENGTIMSTMLGAGYKDGENRYNGVLIGDVRHTADTAGGTGVYGYHEGAQSFGLNIDGTAFMGKSGQGQIQFDGNSGTIQSMSFKTNGTGMKIDLDDGYIDIRGSKITSVTTPGNTTITAAYDSLLAKRNQNVSEINRLTAKFFDANLENINGNMRTLAAAKDKTIARLTNQNKAINAIINLDAYRNNTTFTYDDLNKNEEVANILKNNSISGLSMLFTGTDFFPQYQTTNSKIKIASFDPYLSITSANEDNDISLIKQNVELLHVGDGAYFLQTNDYPKKYLTGTDANNQVIYIDEVGNKVTDLSKRVTIDSGVRIDLANGNITAYNFKLLAKNPWGRYKDSSVEINSNGNPYFKIHYKDTQSPITSVKNNGIDLMKISNNAFLIQSQTWGTDEDGVNHGLQLNLTKGTLRAYDSFNLIAVATQDPKIKPDPSQGETIENTGLDPAENRYYGSSIRLSSSGKPFFKIVLQDHNPNEGVTLIKDTIFDKNSPYAKSTLMENTLMEVSASDFMLRSQDWGYTRQITDKDKNVTYTKRGVEFNLKRGRLTAYGFTLDARKSDDYDRRIQINTDAEKYPFRVDGYDPNDTSKDRYTWVSWDGSLITNYIKADLGGKIGPFTINKSALYTGSDEIGGSGVYLGTEGISVGSGNFIARKNGNTTIDGTTTISGKTTINDNVYVTGNLHVTGQISGQFQITGQGTTTGSGRLSGGGFGGGNWGFGAGSSQFAGWTITENAITSGVGSTLGSHGTMKLVGADKTLEFGSTLYTDATFDCLGIVGCEQGISAKGNIATSGNLSAISGFVNAKFYKVGDILGADGSLDFKKGSTTQGTFTVKGGIVTSISGSLSFGELAFKDDVEISSASFKIGSSVSGASTNLSGVSGYPKKSGDTATYAVKVPGQKVTASGSVSYSGSVGFYVHIDSDGNLKKGWAAKDCEYFSESYSGSKNFSKDVETDDRYVVAKITVKAT